MSVSDQQTIRQCLSLLPLQDFVAFSLDYRKQKLFTTALLQIFITAQLMQWDSLRTIEKAIRSDEVYQDLFGISSIDKSQLSRSIQALPVQIPQALFACIVQRLKEASSSGATEATDLKLALVDSTKIAMPPVLGDWAYVSQKQNSVKIHTRLVAVHSKMAYPDKVLLSTGNVDDYLGSDNLVVEPGTLYVMDRGYVSYTRMERWAKAGLEFVIRISVKHYAHVLEERRLDSENPWVTRDARVLMGNQPTRMETPLRLIEFTDDKGRFYRVVTTRLDLSAAQVAEVYKSRWFIELFFKWLKQHLKVATLYSYQPDAVWNHIYLALVAYGLVGLLQMKQSSLSTWELLRLIRLYAVKPWSKWQMEVERQPRRTSKGRQKKEGPPPPLGVQERAGIQVKQPAKRKR